MLTVAPPAIERESAADPLFAKLRAEEFARLDERGLAYLDYTGSALPAARQIVGYGELLAGAVFGNPHAESGPSRLSTATLDHVRALLLAQLDADPSEYAVCFTANATSAVKLVAESYPFAPDGAYALAADNHNSLNGVREYGRRAASEIVYLPLTAELTLTETEPQLEDLARRRRGHRLFAFPAQSNFSGVQHPLTLIGAAQRLGFDVLLDAAAYLPSCALSLREHRPEFVALSFYKLFGLPTGLGALVARRDALARLKRPWFAGGTVEYVSIQNDVHSLLPEGEAFEDGTPNFLGAAAVPAGFSLLSEIGMNRIAAHVRRLTSLLVDRLRAARHPNGAPAVCVYGPRDERLRGSAVAFNLLDDVGQVIPYWIGEERARSLGVAVRGGCFCNPGAAEAAFAFDRSRAAHCLRHAAANGGFTIQRFAACLNTDGRTPVGALRASLGVANNERDVERLMEVVEGER
jgi:selenocysteine lyase/cysteine desulfurase